MIRWILQIYVLFCLLYVPLHAREKYKLNERGESRLLEREKSRLLEREKAKLFEQEKAELLERENAKLLEQEKVRLLEREKAKLREQENSKNRITIKPYVNMHIGGRLGNQMFQIAAALSLAEDYGIQAIFPDFSKRNSEDIKLNYDCFFPSLRIDSPIVPSAYTFYEHEHFHFKPIPFHPNMEVYGYFQSEKYFKHNKEKICSFFEPSEEICQYLKEKYSAILDHPNTVAIHLRAYKLESVEIEKCFPFLKGEFYMEAADQFPEDALFVIFSDRIEWAKEEMKNFSRPHIFIENEAHYHDFYLMSFCKHQIISPSSFSWWAAYLNKNPDKIVVAPNPWFSPISGHDSSNVIPEGWRTISWL